MKGVGGLDGWRWIFILEGLLTVVISIAAYFFIPNYPATARFLSSSQRSQTLQRLATGDSAREESFNWAGVAAALKIPSVGYMASRSIHSPYPSTLSRFFFQQSSKSLALLQLKHSF